jgi:hypothetical protein
MLLTNKYALIQYDCDQNVVIIETRNLIQKNKSKTFNYELNWQVGLKTASGKSTRKYGCTIVLLSGKYTS